VHAPLFVLLLRDYRVSKKPRLSYPKYLAIVESGTEPIPSTKVCGIDQKAAFRPPSPYSTKPGCILRSRQRSVLEVILQDAGGESGIHGLSLAFYRSHHFSTANDFGSGKACNFCGQNQIDFQNGAWL